ncbi:sn1-specific diacylglycerol lipase alpha [Lingula anatina]|uniref:sn-1-specific diacylglycerol lipase n=1 Tax=Lingula anatina TaxID=7574 RepID=A0A1S3KHG3_LINAN|nr:sn1-specific diacylglycerol lipase alpha [Lingula anatina]|eukprot:XP_013421661.1 sn1-specific diacylglycerol lipase alpha [Lingula anatina]
MPGLVVFNRRWSIGSDDLVISASALAILHLIWLIFLSVCYELIDFDQPTDCTGDLGKGLLGYIAILVFSVAFEILIAWVSTRGTILDVRPRSIMPYLLYARLVVLLAELGWIIYGAIWMASSYDTCPDSATKQASLENVTKRALLGILITSWLILGLVLISIFCVFDSGGAAYVKYTKYNSSLRQQRSWRKRKQVLSYRKRWERRFRWWCCCVGSADRRRTTTFAEIADLFTQYFGELDVVPSDVVAGLVLLRQYQKKRMAITASKGTNDIYQFLSGVPVCPNTRFLRLTSPAVLADYKKTAHFMRYAAGAYGWPFYIYVNPCTGCCSLFPKLMCKCCCCCETSLGLKTTLIGDNCCSCHYAALLKRSGCREADLVYVTWHNQIDETPFYVAIDQKYKKIVIAIRGTLSFEDVLTDLSADVEPLPVDPPREDWLGHKGIVMAAKYVQSKLKEGRLIQQAQSRCQAEDPSGQAYGVVVVGHSLGAGTAAILAMLLQKEYPTLHCYAYSPPGGLLSKAAMEESKSYVTSVVVGKDIITRLGLPQLETVRANLINIIKRSRSSKWRIITGGMCRCCPTDMESYFYDFQEELNRGSRTPRTSDSANHSSIDQISQPPSQPLYPPGRIIHIVRAHPKSDGPVCGSREPVYQAIWADNNDFHEILVSPRMMTDHMPERVMEALNKVLVNVGPSKPSRRLPEHERRALLTSDTTDTMEMRAPRPDNLCLESSYTGSFPEEPDIPNPSRHSSLSWEYTSPLEAAVSTPDKLDDANPTGVVVKPGEKTATQTQLFLTDELGSSPTRSLNRSRTYPFRSGRQPVMVDVEPAPIATPESLSDTSSVGSSSSGSRKYLGGFLKLSEGFDKMDPIAASPSHHKSKGGDGSVAPPPTPLHSTVQDGGNDSTLSDILNWAAQPPVAQSTPYRNTITTTAQVESHPKQLNLDQDENPDADVVDSNAEGDGSSKLSDFNTRSQIIGEKLKKAECTDSYKLTFAESSSSARQAISEGDCTQNGYVPHSPTHGNQQLYNDVTGHYSQGGRGYPHGGYQAPFQHSESDTHLDHAVYKPDQIHRTKDIEDIKEMEDTEPVFEDKDSEDTPTKLMRQRHFSSPAMQTVLSKSESNKKSDDQLKLLPSPHEELDEVFEVSSEKDSTF